MRIGSWATLFGVHADDIFGMAPALPGQHGQTELEIRARFTLLATALRATCDDFATIRAVVSHHLGG